MEIFIRISGERYSRLDFRRAGGRINGFEGINKFDSVDKRSFIGAFFFRWVNFAEG